METCVCMPEQAALPFDAGWTNASTRHACNIVLIIPDAGDAWVVQGKYMTLCVHFCQSVQNGEPQQVRGFVVSNE